MTIYDERVQRLRLYEESNGSYATDHSGTLGDFLECPAIEGTTSLKLNLPMQSPGHLQQHLDGYPEEVALLKDAELAFALNLETFTTRATNGVAAAQGALGRCLKIAMGGETLGTGRLTSSSTTTTSIPMASVSGMNIGGAVAFATGSGSALEVREIKNNASTTLTLKHALTGAPGTTQNALAAATYFMDGSDGSETTSLQAIWEGLNAQDRWLLLGGYLKSMTLEQLGPGSIPRAVFTWGFPQWFQADGSSTAANLVSAGTLGRATYTNNTTLVVKDSEFRSFTVGSTTLASTTLLHATTIEFQPNITYARHMTPAGVQGVKQAVRTRSAPVITGRFVIPYEDTTWRTAHSARTDKDILLQIGSSATDGAILLSAPCVQIVDVQKQEIDGISGIQVSWKGRLDTDTTTSGLTGADLDRALSPFRIHLV